MIIEKVELAELSRDKEDIRLDRHLRKVTLACFRCKNRWIDEATGSESAIRAMYLADASYLKCPLCEKSKAVPLLPAL